MMNRLENLHDVCICNKDIKPAVTRDANPTSETLLVGIADTAISGVAYMCLSLKHC